jgi:hypothetical protein
MPERVAANALRAASAINPRVMRNMATDLLPKGDGVSP